MISSSACSAGSAAACPCVSGTSTPATFSTFCRTGGVGLRASLKARMPAPTPRATSGAPAPISAPTAAGAFTSSPRTPASAAARAAFNAAPRATICDSVPVRPNAAGAILIIGIALTTAPVIFSAGSRTGCSAANRSSARFCIASDLRYRCAHVSPFREISLPEGARNGSTVGASVALVAAFSLFSTPPTTGTPVASARTTLFAVTGSAGASFCAGAVTPSD